MYEIISQASFTASKEFPDDAYFLILRCWQQAPEMFQPEHARAVASYLNRKRPMIIKVNEPYMRQAVMTDEGTIYIKLYKPMVEIINLYQMHDENPNEFEF